MYKFLTQTISRQDKTSTQTKFRHGHLLNKNLDNIFFNFLSWTIHMYLLSISYNMYVSTYDIYLYIHIHVCIYNIYIYIYHTSRKQLRRSKTRDPSLKKKIFSFFSRFRWFWTKLIFSLFEFSSFTAFGSGADIWERRYIRAAPKWLGRSKNTSSLPLFLEVWYIYYISIYDIIIIIIIIHTIW